MVLKLLNFFVRGGLKSLSLAHPPLFIYLFITFLVNVLKWFIQFEMHIPIVSPKVVSHVFDLLRTLYFNKHSNPEIIPLC